jgi:hypothetical protein
MSLGGGARSLTNRSFSVVTILKVRVQALHPQVGNGHVRLTASGSVGV